MLKPDTSNNKAEHQIKVQDVASESSESLSGDNTRRTQNRIARFAGKSIKAWTLLLCILALGIGADLYSKSWAFANISPEPTILDRTTIIENPNWYPGSDYSIVIPNVLHFRLVVNRGAVFGVGPGQRWFFMGFSALAVTAAFLVFAFRTRRGQHLAHIAIACVLAGALGNLYDRFTFGAVRDFVHMFPEIKMPFGLNWPGGNPYLFPWVYNIADVLLLLGIALLMLRMFRAHQAEETIDTIDKQPD